MTDKSSTNIDSKLDYKKTKLGWIPNEWDVIKIDDLVKKELIEKPMDGNHGNDHPTASDYIEKGIPFITANCLSEGKILFDAANKISKEQADKLRKGHSMEGDVLLSHKGTVGETAIVDNLSYDYIMLTPQVTYYRVKNGDRISRDYIKYFFDSSRFQNILRILSDGGTRSYIGITKQRDLPFLLIPYSEQKKIAEILSTWDRAIETLEQLIAKKEELKKGLMQQLFTGKKRFPGFEGEWEEVRFKDVVRIDAKSLNSKTSPDYRFQYISLSDVENGVISSELEVHEFKNAPSRAKRTVSEGDILMATVRPNLQAFALAKKEHQDMIASTGFAVLTPKKDFNIKYLYHYLYSHHMASQFYDLTVGSNYPAINSSDVKKLKIRIPADKEEMNKIESALTNLDDEIKLIQKNKELFKIQKKGLMQQLLTGKTRVKEKMI